MSSLPQMSAFEVSEARRRLGLSQEQLAYMLGFERRHALSSVETGARPLRAPQQRLLEAYLAGYRPEDWPT